MSGSIERIELATGADTSGVRMWELIDLYSQMGDEDHLEGATRTLYLSRNDSSAGGFDQRRFDDAKSCVRDTVSRQVGSERADAIMSRVFQRPPAGGHESRSGGQHPERVGKKQLAQVIGLTYRAWVRRIADMPPAQRRGLLERLGEGAPNDPARFMKDSMARDIVHLAAGACDASRDPRFLDAVHDFEARSQTLSPDVGKQCEVHLTELRRLAGEIRDRFLTREAPERIGLESGEDRAVCDADLTSLSSMLLKRLFDQTKARVADRVRRNVLRSLKDDVAEQVSRLEEDQSSDVVVRTGGDVFYRKFSGSGLLAEEFPDQGRSVEAAFGKRSAKTQLVKQSIRRMLLATRGLSAEGEESIQRRADGVMEPWACNPLAHSEMDLRGALQESRRLERSQRGVSRILRRCVDCDLVDLDRLEKLPRELFLPFSCFCSIRGMQFVWNRFEFLFAFEQSLRELRFVEKDEDDRRNEQILEKARATAKRLMREGGLSRRRRKQLERFVLEKVRDEAWLSELIDQISRDRAETAKQLAPSYAWFYNHVILPAKTNLKRQMIGGPARSLATGLAPPRTTDAGQSPAADGAA